MHMRVHVSVQKSVCAKAFARMPAGLGNRCRLGARGAHAGDENPPELVSGGHERAGAAAAELR